MNPIEDKKARKSINADFRGTEQNALRRTENGSDPKRQPSAGPPAKGRDIRAKAGNAMSRAKPLLVRGLPLPSGSFSLVGTLELRCRLWAL